jgi:hypothetical protein
MSAHRWSGWPGAWCLDCGAEDQNEICMAVHDVFLTCANGHLGCVLDCPDGPPCTEHVNGPCPCPGEGRADPYMLRAERRRLLALLGSR